MRDLTTVDLFCGAGGITEGFRQAGYNCLFANDFDENAIQTFKLNHPTVETAHGPIEDLDPREIRLSLAISVGELDCLAGGPPCQGFSINAPERFLEDPRNSLFKHYIRFVEEFQPKAILLENVPGMLSLAGGLVFKQMLRLLSSIGYEVSYRILLAAQYGVPQERHRLIVLGSRQGAPPSHPQPTFAAQGRANFTGGRHLTYRISPSEPRLNPKTTIHDAIGDLPALRAGEGEEECPYTTPAHSVFAGHMRSGSTVLRHHVAPRISNINLERLQHIKPGGSWRDIPFELLPAGMKKARTSDHTKRYGRLTADGLATTVMTKMDPHWGAAFHYSQERTLTVREAARVQSFPDRYVFTGSRVEQYRQVGNAVPVLMARAIADALRQDIEAPAPRGQLVLCP